jgi:hypothetical protein
LTAILDFATASKLGVLPYLLLQVDVQPVKIRLSAATAQSVGVLQNAAG